MLQARIVYAQQVQPASKQMPAREQILSQEHLETRIHFDYYINHTIYKAKYSLEYFTHLTRDQMVHSKKSL